MAHTEEDFSEASIDARFDVCLTTCTFAVNIRSGKADRKPIWLQQKYNTVKRKKVMKNIKEERVGVKLRYCQQASQYTVCGYCRHENGICRFTLSKTTICACLPLKSG